MTQTFTETAVHPLAITMENALDGQIVLDGQDVSKQVQGVHLKAGFGEVAEAVLVLNHRAQPAMFDGLARVSIGEEPDPGPAAAKFLSAIDPELLEQAALNRADLDPGRHGLTKAMLAQLTEWAHGRS